MIYINTINDVFVKYASRETLKNFCISNKIEFDDTSFIRDRILSLRILLGYILSPRGRSNYIDLADYLFNINCRIASVAAFSKRRKLIPSKYIHTIHYDLLSKIYENGLAPGRWNGHLLMACDGTTYSLPDTPEMKSRFLEGRKTGKSEQPLARGVVLKDVINDIVIDANMECYGDDEIKLALNLLDKLPTGVRDLSPVVIFDRKYCAYTLIDKLFKLNIDFIIRVKAKFNETVDEFINSKEKEKIVCLQPKSTTEKKLRRLYGSASSPYKVRLIRCHNNIVVMTSLLEDKRIVEDTDTELGNKDSDIPIKDAYALRWTDETTIDFFKNALQIEIFSTADPDTIYQDFYAKVINYNVDTILANASVPMHKYKSNEKPRNFGINRNDALGIISIMFWKALVLNNLKGTMPKMLTQIGRNTCPIKPDRHNPRVFRKIKHNGKFITLGNYREAI